MKGDAAPNINLADDSGVPFRLENPRDKKIVLYFDTAEAVLVGVSPDGSPEQAAFKSKFKQ
jgi:peroxiredoxin